MPTTTFYGETDWESSSGPILSRQLALADLWPEGDDSCSDGTTDKDHLEAGLHPCLAIGARTVLGNQLCGVVMSYEGDATAGLAQLNVAPGFMFKAYVSNILTYNAGHSATYDTSLALGDLVYVDDSHELPAGVTLSRSPANDIASANPKAGMIWYDQDEYDDNLVGGLNHAAGLPITALNSPDYKLVTIMLWPEQT
jgi:hypothetical protein